MARATKAEHERRIEQIGQLLIQGAQRRDVLTWGASHCGVGERQIDKDLVAARERIAQTTPDRTFERGLAGARLNLVWGLALKAGNLPVALKAQHERNRLLSLIPRGDQAEQLDLATIRKNFRDIGAELIDGGALDGLG